MARIKNSDDAIKVHVEIYAKLIALAGGVPTSAQLKNYNDSLYSLIDVARQEYKLAVWKDWEQATRQLK